MANENIEFDGQSAEDLMKQFVSVGTKDGEVVYDNRPDSDAGLEQPGETNDDVDNDLETGDEDDIFNLSEDDPNAENEDDPANEEGEQGRQPSDVTETEDGQEERHLRGREILDQDGDNSDGVRKRRRKRSNAKVRIDELTKGKREAERRAEAAEAALAAARQTPPSETDEGGGTTPAASTQTEPEVDLSDLDKPDPKKFKYGELDTEYVAALTDYNVEVSLRKREAKTRQTEAASRAETELRDNWEKNINPALTDESMPDFEDKVIHGAERGDYPLSEVLGNELIKSPHGAKIAYHLATNVDKAIEVEAMSANAQIKWLGQMEARLGQGSRKKPTPSRKTSQAPTPLRNRARGRAKPDKKTSAMSFAEFEAKVQAEAR